MVQLQLMDVLTHCHILDRERKIVQRVDLSLALALFLMAYILEAAAQTSLARTFLIVMQSFF